MRVREEQIKADVIKLLKSPLRRNNQYNQIHNKIEVILIILT